MLTPDEGFDGSINADEYSDIMSSRASFGAKRGIMVLADMNDDDYND